MQLALQGLHAFYLEANMIQSGSLHSRAGEILDVPRHDYQSHTTIRQIKVWIVGRLFRLCKFQNVFVKPSDTRRVNRAQGYVLYVTVLETFVFDVDISPIFHPRLREIEYIPRGIMRSDPSKLPAPGPL